MRQITASDSLYGYIYLLESNGLFKIGYSHKPKARLTRLQTGSPCPIRLVHTIRTAHYKAVEQQLHNEFAEKRVHLEWFALDGEDIERIKRLDAYGRTPEENAATEANDAAFRARPRTQADVECNLMMKSLFSAIGRSMSDEPRTKYIQCAD